MNFLNNILILAQYRTEIILMNKWISKNRLHSKLKWHID